jgi:RNA polymerase sigma factor (sigma-70 family)
MKASLTHSVEQYYKTGDLAHFMESASLLIMDYCRKRLSRDADTIGDFYLHFYERAGLCLERYKTRQNLPFNGYLATYLRHEFYNFRRKTKRRQINEYAEESIENARASNESATPEFEKAVENLAPEVRLAYRLHTGLRLNRFDLRLLIQKTGDARQAADLVAEMQVRLRKNYRRAEEQQIRVVALQKKIEENSGPMERLKRWKENAISSIKKSAIIFSVSEIARILGQNKSTISRKLRSARLQIQPGNLWQEA